MGNDHFYHEMKSHALKTYKFAQRHSLPEGQSRGVCLGVTLLWIWEKLSTSHDVASRIGRDERIFPRLPDSYNNVTLPHTRHSVNVSTMLMGGNIVRDIERGDDISPAERACGLESLDDVSIPIVTRRSTENIPEHDVVETLTNMVRMALPKGHAICVEIEVAGSSGHAIGVYRSRGATLHFFDSNAGAYEVTPGREQPFFQAWKNSVEKRGWRIGLLVRHGDDRSWYHVYNRYRLR